jgi:hypothetical protein
MAASTAPIISTSSQELDSRRLAVENAIGTLRIEGLELDSVPRRILDRYVLGEISLDEMSRLVHEHTAAIL